MDDELDVSWIELYKDLEKDFDDFYKEKPENIQMFFLYVNQNENFYVPNIYFLGISTTSHNYYGLRKLCSNSY